MEWQRFAWLVLLCFIMMAIGMGLGYLQWAVKAAKFEEINEHFLKPWRRQLREMMLVDWIVGGREGWSVELSDGNPDFGGPEWAIHVFGEWSADDPEFQCERPSMTGRHWGTRRFTGKTRESCLQQAKDAMEAAGV